MRHMHEFMIILDMHESKPLCLFVCPVQNRRRVTCANIDRDRPFEAFLRPIAVPILARRGRGDLETENNQGQGGERTNKHQQAIHTSMLHQGEQLSALPCQLTRAQVRPKERSAAPASNVHVMISGQRRTKSWANSKVRSKEI
jgi:hypothetical protein